MQFSGSFSLTRRYRVFSSRWRIYFPNFCDRRRVCDKDQLPRRRYMHETMVGTCHARRSRSIYFHRALTPLSLSLSLSFSPSCSSPLSHSHSRFFFQISSARVTQPQFSALFNSEQSSCHGNTTAPELIEIEKV